MLAQILLVSWELSWEKAETQSLEKKLFNFLWNKIYVVSDSPDKLVARILTQETMNEKVLSFLNVPCPLIQAADSSSTGLQYTDE